MNTILLVILLIIFLAIFVATAAIALCSLPGWIKIPDKYRKILFSALLLEVVACVIMLFKVFVFGEGHQCQDKITFPKDKNWVVLDVDGNISQLYINDTVTGIAPKTFSAKAQKSASYTLVKIPGSRKTEYFIRNDSAIYLGKISDESLASLNLFDDINVDESISKEVKFTLRNGAWIPNDKDKLLGLDIKVNDNGYCITDTSAKVNKCIEGFNRKLTSFKGAGNAYYFVNISEAKLNKTYESGRGGNRKIDTSLVKTSVKPLAQKQEYVTFSIICIKPKLN